MTAKEIQKLLINDIADNNNYLGFVPNNMSVFDGYECDLLAVRKSLLLEEYEIKISKSDFKADFKKKRYKQTKHEEYLNQKLASRLYYVVPEGLITIDDIPEFAGLVYILNDVNNLYRVRYIKVAKLLHKKKATDKQLILMLRSLSFKYRNLL